MVRLGQILQAEREAQKLTPQQVADKARVSRAFVFRLEKGYGEDFGFDKVARVAEALGMDIGELRRVIKDAGEAARRRPVLAFA